VKATVRRPAALRVVLSVLLVLTVALAFIAVAATSRSGLLWRLSTFTYQANLLAAAFYLWTLVSPRATTHAGVRGAVVMYVVVAGVIWNLFLTGYSMGYTVANFLLHLVVPLLAVAEWLCGGAGRGRVHWWQPLAWLLYPAAYVVLALVVLNHAGRRAPYYFLDPDSVGIAGVVLNICLLGAVFVALSYLILAVGRLGRFAGAEAR
jgi:hypothetical protein